MEVENLAMRIARISLRQSGDGVVETHRSSGSIIEDTTSPERMDGYELSMSSGPGGADAPSSTSANVPSSEEVFPWALAAQGEDKERVIENDAGSSLYPPWCRPPGMSHIWRSTDDLGDLHRTMSDREEAVQDGHTVTTCAESESKLVSMSELDRRWGVLQAARAAPVEAVQAPIAEAPAIYQSTGLPPYMSGAWVNGQRSTSVAAIPDRDDRDTVRQRLESLPPNALDVYRSFVRSSGESTNPACVYTSRYAMAKHSGTAAAGSTWTLEGAKTFRCSTRTSLL